MKITIYLLITGLLSASGANMKTRFRAVKCISFNETLSTLKCFLKPYSRSLVTFNSIEVRKVRYDTPIEVTFAMFPFFFVTLQVSQAQTRMQLRYGTIYRQVFHHEFEWCSVMDGTTNNIVANVILALIRKSSPQLLAPCPFPPVSYRVCALNKKSLFSFQGIREIKNLTLDDSTWPSPISSGFFRIDFQFGKYWLMQFDTEVTSDIKTNMK